ncbi:MAG: hypothetical protein LBM13_00840 [Candidatus Ancillula sp.]|jgi:hypothetical protein|nr:hypothetical protein [Candidatus Ancillula sp.]
MFSNDDTSLMIMLVNKIVERDNISYEDALEKVYDSELAEDISDSATGLFTYGVNSLSQAI